MPLVPPLSPDTKPYVAELARLFSEAFGFCPNFTLTRQIWPVIELFGYSNRWQDSMGTTMEERAVNTGKKYLADIGWSGGKHI